MEEGLLLSVTVSPSLKEGGGRRESLREARCSFGQFKAADFSGEGKESRMCWKFRERPDFGHIDLSLVPGNWYPARTHSLWKHLLRSPWDTEPCYLSLCSHL